MLGWSGGGGAPTLIHLWSRRKHREMSWAAMEYLLAAVQQQSRRLLLEQWLLLAVRTLLIVLLVLAVLRPVFQSRRPVVGRRRANAPRAGDRRFLFHELSPDRQESLFACQRTGRANRRGEPAG